MGTVPIYLDGFATLPLAPEAREAILSVWEQPGNAGSANGSGERAARIIADARADVAALIGAAAPEIIFTSGATEANNLAITGAATAAASLTPQRNRIIVTAIEHKAVLEPAAALVAQGFDIIAAPVDMHGRLDLARLAALLDERVLLASVMLVNNETGVVQPVAEAAALAHAVGAYVHSDAAQAAGKIAIDVTALDVDYLSLSAHKCYGPMGVGALYVAAGSPAPAPLMRGGGQQSGIRPGTEPVALIAGFGAAARGAMRRLAEDEVSGVARAARLLDGIAERQVRFTRITGDHAVVPGSAAIALDGIDGDSLCTMIARDVSLSTGSACTNGQIRISHVLEAMGLSDSMARSVVRIFCDRTLSNDAIDRAVDVIVAAIQRSRLATGEVRQ
ncbi:MAG: aminotransferase class V-fold PLP-dependent enzyme [Myxococcota bacterium]|jgi:cysteine desulfurase